MQIIGFSGKKQSGKDTAANYLLGKCGLDGLAKVNFADMLKNIVCECFGARAEDLWGLDSDKDKILPCGKSGREVLQIVGTDWFRGLDSNCWIRSYGGLLQGPRRGHDLILTSDVRFPNEVKCIQDMGGHVIRLLRAPFPEDKHESETALDEAEKASIELVGDFGLHAPVDGSSDWFAFSLGKGLQGKYFDALLNNRDMTIEQQNEAVWKLVNERLWL